jgi:hypothetical protein
MLIFIAIHWQMVVVCKLNPKCCILLSLILSSELDGTCTKSTTVPLDFSA